MDYPILSDPARDTARAYGVVAGEAKNASRWTIYIGKDGKVLFVDKTVKAGAHGADMAAKLKELGVATRK